MHWLVQAELDAMTNDTGDLATAAKVERLEDEQAGQGPTMMGRQARQLMMSGQGDAGLQAFKVRCAVTPHQEAVCVVCRHNTAHIWQLLAIKPVEVWGTLSPWGAMSDYRT